MNPPSRVRTFALRRPAARPAGRVPGILPGVATINGIPYDVLTDNYQERYARDANQFVVRVKVAWADAADFKREILGFTEVDRGGASTKLKRTLPLLCPWTETKYAVGMELVEYGGEPGGVGEDQELTDEPLASFVSGGAQLLTPKIYRTTDEALEGDDDLEGWWSTDHAIYQIVFARPAWRDTLPDSAIDPTDAKSELKRYIRRMDQFQLRERERPDFGFETVEATPLPVGKVGFVPAVETEFVYVWYQIPVSAVPRLAIQAQALHVNTTAFDPDRNNLVAGSVLFKGARGLDQAYEAAGGSDELYVDLQYVFGHRIIRKPDNTIVGGWNNYLKPDNTVVALRRRNVAGNVPPYPNGTLHDLFVPQ